MDVSNHNVSYNKLDRRVVPRSDRRVIADCTQAQVLYETGFAPRWYVPAADVDEAALSALDDPTFCPYKGIADHWGTGAGPVAFSYAEPGRIRGHLSFDPELLDVEIDGVRLDPASGQAVFAHGADRDLTPAEGARV